MDTFLRPKGLKAIDKEIERLTNELVGLDPETDRYNKIVDNIRILTEAREKKNSSEISNEALLAAAVNIIGLVMILNFERTGSITSKAFGLIWKAK